MNLILKVIRFQFLMFNIVMNFQVESSLILFNLLSFKLTSVGSGLEQLKLFFLVQTSSLCPLFRVYLIFIKSTTKLGCKTTNIHTMNSSQGLNRHD